MRTFKLKRNEDVSGVSGLGHVAVGCQFPTGRIVLEWLPGQVDVRSLGIYANLDECLQVHGHEGRTIAEWDNE